MPGIYRLTTMLVHGYNANCTTPSVPLMHLPAKDGQVPDAYPSMHAEFKALDGKSLSATYFGNGCYETYLIKAYELPFELSANQKGILGGFPGLCMDF
jgi:hypothetical protein